MKNAGFHKILFFIAFFLLFHSFTTLIQAASLNQENSKKQIVASLKQKAKKALLSGNKKQADIYWKQVNSLEPQKNKPVWLTNGISNNNSQNQLKIMEEKKFIQLLYELPYEKSKIELDKRLLFSPNNNKLRMIYLELAKKNDDEIEIERQSKLLGIKQPKTFDYTLLVKYILVIVIILLILYEFIKIFKTNKNE